jgi:hemerythrin
MFSLHSLEREHLAIRRCYAELEETILTGRSLPCILKDASQLVQMMLLHFAHEEQFLEGISLTVLQRQRDASTEIISRLMGIEERLKQGKIGAVCLLLLLGDSWMKEHMQLESHEFHHEGPRPGKRYGIPA